MKYASLHRGSIATVMFVVAMMASSAQALLIDMTVDLGSLNGSAGVLAFDFIPGGGSTGNTVVLSPLSPSGDATSITGDVNDLGTGNGPWLFGDTQFFNELQVSYTALPSTVAFSFQTDDAASSTPDAFSFFVLDSSGILPLITTDDPTRANALFLFDLGVGASGLNVYNADQGVFISSVTVGPNPNISVPEPGILALMLAGFVAAVSGAGRQNARRG